jgi:hypothetical protein
MIPMSERVVWAHIGGSLLLSVTALWLLRRVGRNSWLISAGVSCGPRINTN